MEPNNNNNQNPKPFNNNQNSNQNAGQPNNQGGQKPLNNPQNSGQNNQGGMQKPLFNNAVPQTNNQNRPNQQTNSQGTQKPQNNNQKSGNGKMKDTQNKVKGFFIKYKITTLVVLAIVAVILGAVFSNKNVNAPEEKNEKTEEVISENTTKEPVATTKELSYTEALQAYEGKTITIGDNCVSVPTERTFAVGTRVLVNNIAREPVSFTLDQKSATINSYHYATTSLKNKGIFKLVCNGKESATVTVQ